MFGPGRPLEAQTRRFFEPLFGANFRDVRIHADPAADRAAKALGANAFTVGRNIAFAEGQIGKH